MKEGPDIARIAALIGDPARANILTALMEGMALTAGELAREAGVTPQTASSHLTRLTDGGLLNMVSQGRHRYFALASPEVAQMIEALMGLAAAAGHLRHRPGPRDERLRAARRCYHHLAGKAGVRMHDSLAARGFLHQRPGGLALSPSGTAFLQRLGLDLAAAPAPYCKTCLDWSERRPHLGGPMGRALLSLFLAKGWFKPGDDSRALHFTPVGLQEFDRCFPLHEGERPSGNTTDQSHDSLFIATA
ncbi:MAG: winged helix-turn-helix transcriptional regulator [Tabrizicola sp.]|nr:winged helix-turn-helix transcriptional regulator [Tabrizicola sp.]